VTFGLLALFMTVVGVYGVKSYMVARRTREIGIRVALGATSRDVVGMVVRDGAITTVLGIVGGLVLSIAAGSAIRSMLFGDGKFDTTVIVGSVAASQRQLAAWIGTARTVAPTLAAQRMERRRMSERFPRLRE
jgi:ABC-type antimicrobial peptide transport system permease subunit